jgi:uncharacterized membrane protein
MKDRYGLFIILVVATVVRLYHIGVRDFWVDEAFTGITIQLPWKELVAALIRDTHPPLYFFSLKLFSSIFGFGVISLRLFSALWGILGVGMIYFFTKELFSKSAAYYTALLVAINPFLWQYSQEARMYSMVAFFILLSSYCFVKALKLNQWKWFFLWGISMGLGALTHNMGILFACFFYPLFVSWHVPELFSKKISVRQSIWWKKFIMQLSGIIFNGKVFVGYLIAFGLFSPWLTIFLTQLHDAKNRVSWITPAVLGDLMRTIQMFLVGTPLGQMGMPTPNSVFGSSELTVLVLVTALFAVIIWHLLQKETKKILLVLALGMGFMGVVFWLSYYHHKYFFVARYLIMTVYFVLCLLGVWLSRLKSSRALTALVLYLIILVGVQIPKYPTGYNVMQKNLAAYTAYQNIYVLNSFQYTVAKYYFGNQRVVLYNIDWPEYNPYDWAGVNGWLRRTEQANDILHDPKGILIFDTFLTNDNKERREEFLKNFSLIATYNNIVVYKPSSP